MNDDYKINISVSGSILDNSIDLFLDGVHSVKHKRPSESFFSPDPDLKSALLAITTGVELLLKAKITSIDWKQLFKDPTKANKNKLTDGTLMSINLEKCLKRIEDISTIRFTDKTKEDIDTIRITRNKITHYHHNPQDNEIISLIADAIGVYIEFYKEHIFETFCEEKNRVRYTDRDLKEVKEYVKVRVKRIKEEIKGIAKPITYHFCECPGCLQDVHVLKDKKTVLCSFCMYELDIKECAQAHSEFNNKTKHCPKCSCESMSALHSTDEEEEAWQCVVCGFYINRPQIWGIGKGEKSIDSIKEEYRNLELIFFPNLSPERDSA